MAVNLMMFMPSSALTGGPRVLLNLLERIDAAKLEPTVVLAATGPLTDALDDLGEPYEICVPAADHSLRGLIRAWLLHPVRQIRVLRQFKRNVVGLLQNRQIDVIWVRSIKGVLLLGAIARKQNLPLIWDIGLEKPYKGLFRWLHDWGLRRAAFVVTEAPKQHEQVFGAANCHSYAHKLLCIEPGISESRIETISQAKEAKRAVLEGNAEVNVVQIGTLCERKNQLAAINAIGALQNPNVVLHLVGGVEDEAYAERLRQEVERQRLQRRVYFYGWRNDIHDFLACADIYLMTSHNEGIPYTVHEAMHAALPVIVTDAGGMADAVIHERTGLVVPPDDPPALTDALQRMTQSLAMRQQMGEQGLVHVRNKYVASRWYQRYETLIQQCADSQDAMIT